MRICRGSHLFACLLLAFIGCQDPDADSSWFEYSGPVWTSDTIQHMPVPQAPSVTPAFPNTIAPPVDGDPLSAPQLRIDDLTPLQDGVEASRLLLYGGGLKRRVKASSDTVMVIQPMGAVLAALGGTQWTVVRHLTASTINPKTLAGGSFAASTRYWVYAKVTVGPTLGFIVSTTAPDVGFSYMTGDESALFVSTFVVDGSTALVPYTQSELNFTYDQPVGGTDALQLLVAGNQTMVTSVPLNYSVPTGASEFSFLVEGNVATAGYIGHIRSEAGGNDCARIVADGLSNNLTDGRCPTNAGLSFKYFVSNAGLELTVFTQGFTL